MQPNKRGQRMPPFLVWLAALFGLRSSARYFRATFPATDQRTEKTRQNKEPPDNIKGDNGCPLLHHRKGDNGCPLFSHKRGQRMPPFLRNKRGQRMRYESPFLLCKGRKKESVRESLRAGERVSNLAPRPPCSIRRKKFWPFSRLVFADRNQPESVGVGAVCGHEKFGARA
jgi:hypothetical protein